MNYRLYCTLLALFFALPFIQAQTPVYNSFTALDGLAGNTVYCGVEDIYGNLWFGTDKGLSRFDGNRFDNIGVKEGLPDPEVLDLYADSEGSLWISCFKKNIAVRRNHTIFTEKSDSLLAKIALVSSITNLFEDLSGQKWILEKDYSLYILHKNRLNYKKYERFLVGIFQIGESLFGIQPEGIFRLSPDGDILGAVPVEGLGPVPFLRFTSCVSIGRKLVVSSQQLTLLEYDGTQFRFLAENPNLSGKLYVDSKNQCWLPSPDHGAILFNPALTDLRPYKVFLPEKRVNSVVEDSQGGYWFGTIGEGVFRLNPNGAQVFSLSDNHTPVNVTALAHDGQYLLAGDDKGNVYRIGTPTAPIHLPSAVGYNKTRQITPHPVSGVWVGSDKGLFRLHQGKVQSYEYPLGIKSMLFRKDTLWIGTASSVYYQYNLIDKAQNVKNQKRVTCMTTDSEGFIWTGGTNGLVCEKQAYTYNWGKQFELLNNRIVAIERGGDGVLWAATPQDGLMRLWVKGGNLVALEKMMAHLGSTNLSIQSLYCEPSGKLWIATNQGVYALTTDLQTEYYGTRDGLTNQEVNCVLVVRDTLWAGTVSGLSCLPLRYNPNVSRLSARFSNIAYQINGVSIHEHVSETTPGPFYLPKEARLVELNMNVLDFNSTFNPNYECTLKSRLPALLDLTFPNLMDCANALLGKVPDVLIGPNGQFNLGVDLRAGVYELQGTARAKAGNQMAHTTPLLLVKPPYWYETVWFWLLLVALGVYALYRFLKYRNKVKLMHLQVAELRLLALQAQINPHFVGNSVSAIQQFFYPPDPVKASRYIAIMTRLLRKTMEFSDKHFIPFQEEHLYIQDYLDMAQLRFEHRFQYHIEHNLGNHVLFPAMILQPLLENATIHGLAREGNTLITVDFEDQGDRIECCIRDNGPGIDSTRHTPKPSNVPQHKSMGLELIRKKIKTLNTLYPYDIHFQIKDRHHDTPPTSGTLVVLSMKKVQEQQNTEPPHA